jgi:hypothetical protein
MNESVTPLINTDTKFTIFHVGRCQIDTTIK